MKNQIKAIIMPLIVIFTVNGIFKILRHNFLDSSIEDGILAKSLLIPLVLYFIFKERLIEELKPTKNSIGLVIISVILIILSIIKMKEISIDLGYNLENITHLKFLIYCLIIGFGEELIFRFFTFNTLLKQANIKIVKSMIISSILFGLVHITNAFDPNYATISVINQIIFAISIGVLFQSLYIRFNSLFLISTLHGLVNYFGSYKHYLLKDIKSMTEPYTTSDFFTTLIIILLISVIIILPISYKLIEKNLREESVH